MKKVVDLAGQRFGKLVAICRDDRIRYSKTGEVRKDKRWRCICDCGNESYPAEYLLAKNGVSSCGCIRLEKVVKHRMSLSVEYSRWGCMKERCYREKAHNYQDYGGRGIKVCPEWVDDFLQFYEDMGPCPEGYTLERLDVEKDYSKDNCKWADKYTQAANQRKSSRNTSGRTGVYFKESSGLWGARICREGQVYQLGLYATFEEAVRVREEAELKYFGFLKPGQ